MSASSASSSSGGTRLGPALGAAIGHVRYSTTGESSNRNVQPFVVRYQRGQLAVAHRQGVDRRMREPGGVPGRVVPADHEEAVGELAPELPREVEQAVALRREVALEAEDLRAEGAQLRQAVGQAVAVRVGQHVAGQAVVVHSALCGQLCHVPVSGNPGPRREPELRHDRGGRSPDSFDGDGAGGGCSENINKS